MRPRFFAVFPLALLLAAILVPSFALAQKQRHDVLTEAQVEKIREAGIDPNQRIKLYTEYLNDHVNTVKGLTNRRVSDARAQHLDRDAVSAVPRPHLIGQRQKIGNLVAGQRGELGDQLRAGGNAARGGRPLDLDNARRPARSFGGQAICRSATHGNGAWSDAI